MKVKISTKVAIGIACVIAGLFIIEIVSLSPVHGQTRKLSEDEMGAIIWGKGKEIISSIKEILNQVMPEYPIKKIPKDHEIYNNFYELTEPIRGHAKRLCEKCLNQGKTETEFFR